MNRLRVNIDLTLRCVALIVLANAPFWLLGQLLFMSRATINVDVIAAICVMLFHPMAGLLLLGIVWSADLILSQSITFHFRTALEFMRSLEFVSTLDLSAYATWEHVALALPFVCCALAMVYLARKSPGAWRPAVVIGAALLLLDSLNGSSMASDRSTLLVPVNFAGSPVATLGAVYWHETEAASLVTLPAPDIASELVDVSHWAQANPSRSVLFIIVESFGAPRAARIRQWLDMQLIDESLTERYHIARTELKFRGSTTSGELRSLCGLAGSYQHLDAEATSNCLPARMRRLGWTTIGMHGFSGRMFDRQHWWPLIGLQSVHFTDSPLLNQGPLCGMAFKGVCDARLMQQAIEELRPGARFVYLLTLNTHLPLQPTPVPADLAAICTEERVHSDACTMISALGTVLSNVRSSVGGAGPAPLVIVVGDHAPPFNLQAPRDAFSADQVPAFALIPRE